MMIEIFTADNYDEVRKKYIGKIVLILPYNENKVSIIKEKAKIVKLKKGNSYNFLQSVKYSHYDYFLLISLTDIKWRINEVLKRLGDIIGDGKV